MSLKIIEANPKEKKSMPKNPDEPFLEVAEFFCDTIQGENFVGWPAAFLRLQHCTMSCHWCDTTEVWHYGNPYSITELMELMAEADLPWKLNEGQHLILSGGSPLKQQEMLVEFFREFVRRHQFIPFVEIENECTIMPIPELLPYIRIWNNSPKLKNSGNPDIIRYQPKILEFMNWLHRGEVTSWFKFVILDQFDWMEIKRDFLDPGLIRKEQIVLMPQGATREELKKNQERVLEVAIKENVRYTPRLHIDIWDRKTGV